jgi:prevent-host-death family protein
MKATAKDLRFHSKEILETVSRGEEVIITVRGKPQAKLVPYDSGNKGEKKQTALFGIWHDNDKVSNVEQYVRSIRKGRTE